MLNWGYALSLEITFKIKSLGVNKQKPNYFMQMVIRLGMNSLGQ
jgi:hypothetical protein